MLEKIVQVKSIGRFRNYSDIPEAVLPRLRSGEILIRDAVMIIGGLV